MVPLRGKIAPLAGGALRGAAGAAVAAAAFAVLRWGGHFTCIIPFEYEQQPLPLLLFFLLPVVFAFGFVWLISEITLPFIAASGRRATSARLWAILCGLIAYAAVGVAGYAISPKLPGDLLWQEGYREIVWALWPIGMLVMSGNYSNYHCGV